MSKIAFIIGGARSGKSRFCIDLAKSIDKKVLFIATCTPKDREMKKRVSIHKRLRPRHWKTIEEDKEIKSVLIKYKEKFNVIIIDCLGLFISNLLLEGFSEKRIQKEIKTIAQILSSMNGASIVVSNEVGTGIIPDNPLARLFRDLMGLSNQIISQYADTVYIMQAGIPIKIK